MPVLTFLANSCTSSRFQLPGDFLRWEFYGFADLEMVRTLLFNPEALINKVNMLLKGFLSSLDCKLQEGRDYSNHFRSCNFQLSAWHLVGTMHILEWMNEWEHQYLDRNRDVGTSWARGTTDGGALVGSSSLRPESQCCRSLSPRSLSVSL